MGRYGTVYHGFCVNVVAVVFINHKDTLVARYTGDKGFSGGVSVYHASGAVAAGIDVTCAGGALFWWRYVICNVCISGWLLHVGRGVACRPDVSSHLAQVPLVHVYVSWWVLADSGGSETRPGQARPGQARPGQAKS
jgi:hypothetical protein